MLMFLCYIYTTIHKIYCCQDAQEILFAHYYHTGVIGSDVPWLDCPACNALTWVITVTE